ncbi:ATP-binding cassette subfamily C protein CydC [Leucobacter exalbidus]|uniref:ATP-binding cassette subfamily C protein CydC n=1 Tax=Leucobacter exalbidus TaxID=662960 RepID=A0A940PJG6_9MICO|nr:thiol reductant ABC exporter subunit CydC [Leucobacter exalbidus]MBP1325012.1 ATP-binding cassette subfamily C protein CydC [Leucobacter exalbidus]
MSAVTPRERVIARALPPRAKTVAGNTLGALADLCVVGLLGLSMWLIVSAAEQPPILHLTFAIVGVRALAIGRAALRYTHRLNTHDAALAQLAPLRAETFTALVPRVPGALPTSRRGELLAAFVDDVDQLQDEPLRVRGPLVTSAIVVALSLIAVALISPVAALVLFVSLAVSGALAIWLAARSAGSYDRELSAARARLSDALLERFTRTDALAAFGALGQARATIADAEAQLSRVQLGRAGSAGRTGAILACGAGAATLVTLLLVAPSALNAPLMAAVTVLPTAVFEIFAQVPAAFAAARAVRASADRVAGLTEGELPAELPVELAEGAVLEAPAAGAAGTGAVAPLADTTIELIDVAVRHPGASRPAVAGVNLTLRPGETLIVTGESGAGKSTLALALEGFLNYEGSYLIGGVEARSIPTHTLRATVGLCEQTPHLFDTDLRQNLKFARDTATDDELWAVLERVGLADWARPRGGLDAWTGERGALVSGGQGQRIALARVLLADFPVVLLDEPTAGVDGPLADKLLRDLMEAVPADRSVLLITHAEVPAELRAERLALAT